MKLLAVLITLMISSPSQGATHRASSVDPVGSIRLYMRTPIEKRMIASYREIPVKRESKGSLWAKNLRNRHFKTGPW